MKKATEAELRRLSARYIWWKTPDEAMQNPRRIMAQVMNLGDYDDMRRLGEIAGNEELCDVLRQAEAGEFNERSWHYWHYRLRLADLEKVPPLPQRDLP
ncbi:MAG: hypothetical protein PHE55_21325 [Methylococcaceae bacterium]|nr:hypothetical protein [Methylococcaceae bacterium]